ncbi:MAG TPA: hypothetical protein VK453_25025 [Micromonosporaceae bacterium]|nr:hypothetical protein [Micromonosporaceae bacterium]
MSQDPRRTAGAVWVTLMVLGVGVLVSVLVGLLVGWLIDDMGRGLGLSVAIGMGITAVVGVAANLRSRRR